jgi:hypothetical protein
MLKVALPIHSNSSNLPAIRVYIQGPRTVPSHFRIYLIHPMLIKEMAQRTLTPE